MKRQSFVASLIGAGLLLGLTLPVSETVAAGKLYKWVDDNGNVTYQDQPPPENVTPEVRNLSDNGVGSTDTSAEIEASSDAAPVALYSVPDCDVCDVVRLFLANQGVPFDEKNLGEVNTQKELMKLGGRLEVPTVTVGDRVVTGYRKRELVAVLQEGGYAEVQESGTPFKKNDSNNTSPAADDQSELTTDSSSDGGLIELMPQDEPFKDQ